MTMLSFPPYLQHAVDLARAEKTSVAVVANNQKDADFLLRGCSTLVAKEDVAPGFISKTHARLTFSNGSVIHFVSKQCGSKAINGHQHVIEIRSLD